MSFQFFVPWPFLSIWCFLFLVVVKIQPSLSNAEIIRSCSLPFSCGKVTASYPFWGGDRLRGCGHPDLELMCEKNTATMTIGELKYRVLDIDPKGEVLSVAREDYFDGLCPQINTTIDEALFNLSAGYEMFKLLYGICPMFPGPATCYLKDVRDYMNGFIPIGANIPPGCNMTVNVPVSETLLSSAKCNKTALLEALGGGFKVKWKLIPCHENCSSCGYDIYKKTAICYCPGGQLSNSTACPTSTAAQAPKGSKDSPGLSFSKRIIYIGVTVSVVGIIVIVAIVLYVVRGRFQEKTTEDDQNVDDQNVEAFVRNYGSLAPKRFNFFDVERMTKSFSNKLGQGGYGDVYKGKLPDGRLVAVKVFKKSEGNGEEFINEVASISRTSHVNIVNFLGFCCEKSKRALIYEFMPNGFLDNFICGQETSSSKTKLQWRTMYKIAVGIARGLEYLHRGCSTRIVHFDIKPQNILLDEDFCRKISDFGLSKQSQKKESIMSMLDARGTIGYIAPEVFCRTFGGVSHKSDVYSYGMMILEMVGGRRKVDAGVSHSSEQYFPNSIYKHLEPGSDFQFHGVVTEEEKEMAKQMILVSMWCIQTNPSDRPSMTKVVELLEGSLENLQTPPKPTLSLPTRSDKQSRPTSLSTDLESLE